MKDDKELQILLSKFREKNPTQEQLNQWKQRVFSEAKVSNFKQKNSFKSYPWIHLVAASFIGFVIGALIFKGPSSDLDSFEMTENNEDNATIEYVFINSN